MVDARIRRKSYDKRRREMEADRDDRSHGTFTGYKYGCRCFRCRLAAHDAYEARKEAVE